MPLLPDMIIVIRNEEHKLSLQDPYTLDGVLIDEIATNYSTNYRYNYDYSYRLVESQDEHVRIRNKYGRFITLPVDQLDYYVRNTVNAFLGRNDCVRVGESQRYMWTIRRDYNGTKYINDLRNQCEKINRYSTSYDGYYYGMSYTYKCMDRLYAQGRLTDTATTIPYDDSNSIRATTLSDIADANWFGIGNTVEESGLSRLQYEPYGQAILQRTVVQVKPEKKYIHDYNYKPEYIKHRMPDEDSSLLLGAEIEVDCGGESEEHAKKVLEIVCGINPDNPEEALEDKMYCTHDGSLRSGIEFDTMPCTLEYHKKEMKYKEMFEYLDKNGYKAHDTTTCGLHVHADRSYLGKSELVQQLTISKILYILEKFNDEICVIARRNNNYSKFVGKSEVNKSLDKLYGKYNSSDKHVALNLKHKESIEFRCFKGTLKYETFILTLEFVKNIIDYAKSINIEEIELIQWNDLMNTFSEELKKYYNDRLEKEKNKEKSEEKKDNSYRTGFFDNCTVNWNTLGNLFSNTSSTLSDFRVAIINSNAESNSNTECTEVELKKKEIKALKKKIKNSNNYMEKKQLNQDLAKLNKELKKLKRQSAA